MKKFFYLIIGFIYYNIWLLKAKAVDDSGIFWWAWLTQDQVRRGEISIDDIPWILRSFIDFWMWVAWTVAVIFVIIWAYQILFWSIEQDKSKWKNTIFMAIMWFVIASLAWFIIRLIIDNFWG